MRFDDLKLKWILVRKADGTLDVMMGKVKFHSDLLKTWFDEDEGDKCLGGGQFHMNNEGRTITLWGNSHDYGWVPSEYNQDVLRLFKENWRYNKNFDTYQISSMSAERYALEDDRMEKLIEE